jgi:hypothetical protein
MEVDKIMRTLLTLGANASTPRRHGSGKKNEMQKFYGQTKMMTIPHVSQK